MKPLVAFGVGAVGGALVGGAVWWFARRQLDQSFARGSRQLAADLGMGEAQLRQRLLQGQQQLQNQLTAQINVQIPLVLHRQLAAYGITPQLVSRVNRVLVYGERVGAL